MTDTKQFADELDDYLWRGQYAIYDGDYPAAIRLLRVVIVALEDAQRRLDTNN